MLLLILLPSASSPARDPVRSPIAGETFRGDISNWRLLADGTVLFELNATKPKKMSVWFRSPANKTSTTKLEDLLLRILLDASSSNTGYEVTVQSESDAANSGKKADEAIDLGWIGRS